jgi:D-tyrosyl-tRNA(Tyr) deacylase
LVVISSENQASQNIKSALLSLEKFEQRGERFWSCDGFDMAEYPGSIVEIVPRHDAKYYIFASTHKSESGKACFTVHTPGNWGEAALGGRPQTLNTAMPSVLKAAAQKMRELSAPSLNWPVSVEVDHHGPTLSKPAMFAEIGSSQEQWQAPEAGMVVAQAIVAAIKNELTFPAYVGFGGTHYAPKFTPKIVDGEMAFGHIISGYALERYGLDGGRLMQAMNKNSEKIEGALVDWKGIKGGSRKSLVALLDQMGIKWEKA